jgi:hypothetical protein
MRYTALMISAVISAFVVAFVPAAAQSCTMPAAAVEMDGRYAGVSDCTEVETFSIDTPGGSRQVRIIRDPDMPDFWTEPLALVKRGILGSASALSDVSGAQVGNLTVIVSGLLPDPDDSGRQWLDGIANAPLADGECAMIVYPANTGPRAVEFTTAHEFFHCVQYQTAWDQMRAFRAGQPGSWWVEGMAEWFANLAFPGTGNSDSFIADFDESSPAVPLTGMTYGNAIFFSWYTGDHGGDITGFMRAMPVSGGMAAEKAALANAVPADVLLTFVERYLDRDISQPGGRPIPSSPKEGPSYLWLEDERYELEADRLVVHRASLVFTCGTWTIGLSGEKGRWSVKEEGGSWEDLPATFEVESDQEKRYLFGGIGGGAEGLTLTINGVQSDDEGKCNCKPKSPEDVSLDSCVVGVWELESGGGMEWLDKLMKREIRKASGPYDSYDSNLTSTGRRIKFTDRGLYLFGMGMRNAPLRTAVAKKKYTTVTTRWEGGSSSIGTWSAEEGTLSACAITYISDGSYLIQDNTGASKMFNGNFPSDHIHTGGYAYNCSETTLNLRFLGFRGMGAALPPLEWVYRRVVTPE